MKNQIAFANWIKQKMKYSTIVILILSFYLSCKNNSDNSIYLTSEKVMIEPRIDSTFRLFLNEVNCAKCLYMLYIDKIDPNSIIFTFKASSYPKDYFVENFAPLLYCKVDSKDVFVFTGMEDVFKGDFSNYKNDSAFYKGSSTVKIWNIIETTDTFYILKDGNRPFTQSVNRILTGKPGIEFKVDDGNLH